MIKTSHSSLLIGMLVFAPALWAADQVINGYATLVSYKSGLEAPAGVFGDCNLDGVVSLADINRLADWINNRVPKPAPGTLPFMFCDVNGDGVLDATDATLISDRLVGKRYGFVVENWGDGDADMDGALTMNDLNRLVDWILGRPPLPVPGSVQFLLADVNGDGRLDMYDLNLYVDKILARIPVLPANKLYGDSNLDGVFSGADADLLQAWILGSKPKPAAGSPEFIRSDVNGDGVLDVADLNLYNDMLLIRITRFPVQPPVLVPGDSNSDLVFNNADIDRFSDWLVGRVPMPAIGTIPFILSDVDGDGALTLFDLNIYVDKMVGRITKFRTELYGNSNLDGVLDNNDMNLIQAWILGSKPMPAAGSIPFVLSDVNGDGSVTTADLNLYADRLAGRISRFPAENCAPGKYYDVLATWKNSSASGLSNVWAQLATLTGGNQLSTRTIDQTADRAIVPGESFVGTFRIKLASCNGFSFLINLRGTVN